MSEATKRATIELIRRKARLDMLTFLKWCWWMPTKSRPLKIGRHTRSLCNRLTRAVIDWRAGKSTYLIINMPFRHGKSDLVSRALPAFFLGACADAQPDVIMSGYGTSLVKGFSKKVQSIMRSDAYQQLYPGVLPSILYHAAEEWSVEGSQGTVIAQGLGGSITGKGGNLIIVDDYCKNREEAESKTIRDKTWDSFSDDLMTRTNAPAAIVIVCATRWHEDDIVGRIYESMRKDPGYPRFESLIFPARKAGPDGWDILFPELYDEDWYTRQRAQLGSYSAAALLDCDPIGDAMKVFKESWLCFYDTRPQREKMNVYIFVDSANVKKKQKDQDPDFTTMLAVGYGGDQNYYLLDAVHDRLNLKERTDALFELHRKWRPNTVFWEQVGAMSDVAHIQDVMDRESWHFSIVPLNHTVAKDTRIRSLQPLFEAGRMWLPRTLPKTCADGNVRDLIEYFVKEEYKVFPGCKHDDFIDPLADINDIPVKASTSFPQEDEFGDDAGRAVTNWHWKR